jgi:uncharacterized protein
MRFLILLVISAFPLFALNVGDTVANVTVRDSSDNPVQLPDLGNKVLLIFYTDPDVGDMNDEFADAVKKEGLPKTAFRGLGIANMKDTWKPNAAIRMVVRKKEAKYNSVILTDPDHLLVNAWNLGSCDDASVVILVGKDKKVHYFRKGKVPSQETQVVIKKIRELVER